MVRRSLSGGSVWRSDLSRLPGRMLVAVVAEMVESVMAMRAVFGARTSESVMLSVVVGMSGCVLIVGGV
jgi:hypothetical protein